MKVGTATRLAVKKHRCRGTQKNGLPSSTNVSNPKPTPYTEPGCQLPLEFGDSSQFVQNVSEYWPRASLEEQAGNPWNLTN